MSPTITEQHIDAVYDALAIMRLFSQRLSEGAVEAIEASEMSWLLGTSKKRLDTVLSALEELQDHERRQERDPQDDVLEIGSQILALMQKFQRTRAEREARG